MFHMYMSESGIMKKEKGAMVVIRGQKVGGNI